MTNVFIMIITPIIFGILGVLFAKVENVINKNIENEKVREYLNYANDVVRKSVITINQAYVDTLKAKGEFTKEAQTEAKANAIEVAKALLNEESINVINKVYGDFDVWLSTSIEEVVKSLKG